MDFFGDLLCDVFTKFLHGDVRSVLLTTFSLIYFILGSREYSC